MIITIPLDENQQDVCPAFGRAPFFLVFDSEQNSTQILSNPAADEQGGAGLKSAQFVVDRNTDILITPRCGENAAEVLHDADIQIYKSEGNSAENNLKAFSEGSLSLLTHFHAGFVGGHS